MIPKDNLLWYDFRTLPDCTREHNAIEYIFLVNKEEVPVQMRWNYKSVTTYEEGEKLIQERNNKLLEECARRWGPGKLLMSSPYTIGEYIYEQEAPSSKPSKPQTLKRTLCSPTSPHVADLLKALGLPATTYRFELAGEANKCVTVWAAFYVSEEQIQAATRVIEQARKSESLQTISRTINDQADKLQKLGTTNQPQPEKKSPERPSWLTCVNFKHQGGNRYLAYFKVNDQTAEIAYEANPVTPPETIDNTIRTSLLTWCKEKFGGEGELRKRNATGHYSYILSSPSPSPSPQNKATLPPFPVTHAGVFDVYSRGNNTYRYRYRFVVNAQELVCEIDIPHEGGGQNSSLFFSLKQADVYATLLNACKARWGKDITLHPIRDMTGHYYTMRATKPKEADESKGESKSESEAESKDKDVLVAEEMRPDNIPSISYVLAHGNPNGAITRGYYVNDHLLYVTEFPVTQGKSWEANWMTEAAFRDGLLRQCKLLFGKGQLSPAGSSPTRHTYTAPGKP